MKSWLSAAGLGFLVCIPCLFVIAGISLAAFGGGLVAFATSPVTQAAGALLLLAAFAFGVWYLRLRQRPCSTCGVREAGHQSHAAEQRTPLP